MGDVDVCENVPVEVAARVVRRVVVRSLGLYGFGKYEGTVELNEDGLVIPGTFQEVM